jgi:MFS family permease
MMAVGGMTMVMQSISPIYAAQTGFSTQQIGILLFVMQIGLLGIQLPFGALSDRIDRRYVLAIVAFGCIVIPMVAFTSHGALSFLLLVILFTFWNGFNETIYSVSSALANDRADPADYVMLSATQMISWSAAAFIIPLGATFCLAFLPVQFYMLICVTIGIIFFGFVIVRIRARNDVPIEDKEAFKTLPSQIAISGDFANSDLYEDENAGTTSGLIN